MHAPFSFVPPDRRGLWLGVLLGLLAVGALVMWLLPPVAQQAILYGGPRPKGDLFSGWVSVFGPIVDSVTCFRLWPSQDAAPKCHALLRDIGKGREAWVVLADCLFAIGYGAGGGLGAWWLGGCAAHKPWSAGLWRIAAWSLLVAGASDVVENLSILAMIAGAYWEALVVVARAVCLSKSLGMATAVLATIGAGITWWLAPSRKKNGGP